MRFSVEQWAPDYGSSIEATLAPSHVEVDTDVETPAARWEPCSVPVVPGGSPVVFVDGVRRVDARLWIHADPTASAPGIFASYAAGAVRCGARATVERVWVRRRLYASGGDLADVTTRHGTYEVRRCAGDDPDVLSLDLQRDMAELEAETAVEVAGRGDEIAIVDGPLRSGHVVAGASGILVGYVKSHHRAYLPDVLTEVVGRLEPGQRCPLFVTGGRHTTFSWYARLPGASGHPLAGIVRCELSAATEVEAARTIADRVTCLVQRYASTPHKDARAPQNLHPIAGLERRLRDRLGDPQLLLRSLMRAARTSTSGGGVARAES
ncbi:MAG: hypothetical protein IT198_02820 [Acidimicrobiia bacterium]|nr:hypothetical protein [Acidimicrobiia bacterium]